jgi:hypothetical protein
MTGMRIATLVSALVAALALLPASARGDGLPVPVDDAGPSGLATVDGSFRYVTLPARGDTVLQKVEQRGGRIRQFKLLHGTFTIPVVALDGTPAGLSRDGATLVVVRPRDRFPRARTELKILDTDALHVRRRINLRGDFSFDAMSPDGRVVYLIQYVDPRNPNAYLVRTLDPTTGRLDPHPVVDPNESGDDMRGMPLTRATSGDGRWAYTLYDGAGDHPFVHALDTVGRRAKCIDLPASVMRSGHEWFRLRVDSDDRRLVLSGERTPLYTVDTHTFRVSPAASASHVKGDSAAGGGDLITWPRAAGIVAALVLVGGAIAVAARRRHPRAVSRA